MFLTQNLNKVTGVYKILVKEMLNIGILIF